MAGFTGGIRGSVSSRGDVIKVAAAASLGTLMDYFDFYLAAVAAVFVWPNVFYPSLSANLALAVSIATFGISFFTRPIGAFLFGHFGDRMGRKAVLVWTLLTMGIGTFGVAATPGYVSIGIVAVLLLIVFRILQGMGVGGEWGGAVSWVSEVAANSKWRAFWNSWSASVSIVLGVGLGVAAFASVSSLPRPVFLSWGWRVPFLIGSLLLVLAAIVRYRLMESPLFSKMMSRGSVDRMPSVQVLKRYWKRILLLGVSWAYIVGIFNLGLTFSINFMVGLKIPLQYAYFVTILGAVLAAVLTLIGGVLGDIIGRKPILMIGALLTLIFVFPYMLLIQTLNPILVALASIILFGSLLFGHGGVPALFAEQFPIQYRYSGSGLSYQVGALITGLATAVFLPLFIVLGGGPVKAWPYVAGFSAALALMGLLGASAIKDTKGVTLEE